MRMCGSSEGVQELQETGVQELSTGKMRDTYPGNRILHGVDREWE